MSKALKYFNGDELAASTWENKYAAKGENTPDDTHRRLAREFFRIENDYNFKFNHDNNIKLSAYGFNRKPLSEDDIFNLFKDFKYVIPGGSVMAGLGTDDLVSLSNCFVIGSPEDSYSSIMNSRNQQVQLMKRRGGVGLDLSKLRPRGAAVNNAAKTSTGAASFMDVYSDITNEVAQNGRRGALMLSISIAHPDVEEFITKKQDLSKVTGANISVKVTDEFMQAVEQDNDYIQTFPINYAISKDIIIDAFEYNKLYHDEHLNVWFKKIRAKELWDTLMNCAWNTAEPGIMFESRMHNYSPDGVYEEFKGVSSNPCGEIFMGPFDSCRLIHLNLTSFINNPFSKEASLNTEHLYSVAYEAMRLADDLVTLEMEAVNRIINTVENDKDKTEYILWSRIYMTALQGRRAGLGFTGLADAIAMLGLKYDSDEGLAMVETIMSTIFKGELDSTIDLAVERGPFTAFDSRKEFEGNDWYKFIKDKYPEQYTRMQMWGRRNLSFSTVAPTGTVSIMAQCSSGIEPVFMPFYERRRKCMLPTDRVDYVDIKGEKFTKFMVVHPKFKEWITANIKFESNEDYEMKMNSPEFLEELFVASPYRGSTASEINWHQRVKLQGIVQKYITHSISSTVNLPKETSQEEIANIYMEAWKAGNKGQTIYRDGCREGILNKVEKPNNIEIRQAPKRPKELEADYYQVKVKGEQFIVLVGLLNGKPYEIFTFRPLHEVNIPTHKGILTKVKKMHYTFNSRHIHLADLQNVNTDIEEVAATLYSSMLLRHGVDLEYIIKTARKVNDNITSFSSAMCRVLSKYIGKSEVKGETCPSCGGRLVREGGCIKCLDCDYSKCL